MSIYIEKLNLAPKHHGAVTFREHMIKRLLYLMYLDWILKQIEFPAI